MSTRKRFFPFNAEQTVNILSEFGPLVTMFVVNAVAGINWGTRALIVTTIAAIILMRIVLKRLPVFPPHRLQRHDRLRVAHPAHRRSHVGADQGDDLQRDVRCLPVPRALARQELLPVRVPEDVLLHEGRLGPLHLELRVVLRVHGRAQRGRAVELQGHADLQCARLRDERRERLDLVQDRADHAAQRRLRVVPDAVDAEVPHAGRPRITPRQLPPALRGLRPKGQVELAAIPVERGGCRRRRRPASADCTGRNRAQPQRTRRDERARADPRRARARETGRSSSCSWRSARSSSSSSSTARAGIFWGTGAFMAATFGRWPPPRPVRTYSGDAAGPARSSSCSAG